MFQACIYRIFGTIASNRERLESSGVTLSGSLCWERFCASDGSRAPGLTGNSV